MRTQVSTSASRPHGRAQLLAVLAILVVAIGLGTGGVAAQSAPPSVSAICQLMFDQAIVPAATPTPDPFATTAPDEADLTIIEADPSALDGAIRACASLDEWEALSAAHPEVFADVDPKAFLEARCLDPDAGLDAYATCASLAIVRAAETPVPVISPEPGTSAGPGDGPRDGPSTTPALVKVPSGLKSRVRGANDVSYFPIGGQSPLELIGEASRKSAKFCPADAAACTRHRPVVRVATLIDSQTGACRVTGIRASFRSDVFLPRWTEPAMVDRDLRDWWERMFSRIVAHEARHIKIANAHLKDLKRRAVGRRCESFRVVYERWSDDVNKDQAAFDRRDAQRPLPPYQGEPVQP